MEAGGIDSGNLESSGGEGVGCTNLTMPIPNQPQFEELLNALSLERPREPSRWRQVLVQPERTGLTHEGQKFVKPALFLWFKDFPSLSFDAFCRKLRVELRARKHADSDEVLFATIGAFLSVNKNTPNKADALNGLLESIVTMEVSHFWIYPCSRIEWFCCWKGFRWGLLNADLLKSRCRRAGSDFWDLYGKHLEDLPAWQSPDYQRSVIDWTPHILKTGRGDPGTPSGELILNYFEHLSRTHEEMAWRDIEEKQSLLTAFDLDMIEVKGFKDFPVGQKVVVYLGSSKRHSYGYVCPVQMTPHMNWMPPDGELLRKARAFEAEHELGELPDSELTVTILSVARYAQLARVSLRERQFSDSLLNAVIALEILFSERESATNAVSSRTAVVVHRAIGKTFAEMRDEISKLYDLRSSYVHRGKQADAECSERALAVLQYVLKCLLRLQKDQNNLKAWSLKSWLKRLDWIKASIEAGEEVPSEKLSKCGIGL